MFVPRVDNRFRGKIKGGDPSRPPRGALKQAYPLEKPRGTADIVVRAAPQIGLPSGWLRIAFVESLLMPVGIDGSFVANGVQAGDFLRRQFPT